LEIISNKLYYGIIQENSILGDGKILMIQDKGKKLGKDYNIFLGNMYTKVNFWEERKMVMES
jgi:hypothetical protein